MRSLPHPISFAQCNKLLHCHRLNRKFAHDKLPAEGVFGLEIFTGLAYCRSVGTAGADSVISLTEC